MISPANYAVEEKYRTSRLQVASAVVIRFTTHITKCAVPTPFMKNQPLNPAAVEESLCLIHRHTFAVTKKFRSKKATGRIVVMALMASMTSLQKYAVETKYTKRMATPHRAVAVRYMTG